MKPKSIQFPDIEGAKILTPMQLNAYRLDRKHTILTPDRLAESTSAASQFPAATAQVSATSSSISSSK